MYAIYRNAELVIIWLQLQKHEQKGLRRVMRWGGRPKLMPKVLHRVVHRRLSSYEYAIRGALDNPYWGRVWIVQEVVVAKKVRVTTGDISIGLDELRTLAETFVNAGSWTQGPSMWVLCDMRAVGGKVPLWRILRDFKRYQSTRPADRVFGMLGMVEDHEDGSSPVENISVDYEKPIRHLLLDAIFESSPPLAECRMTIHCLGPEQFHNGFSLLRRYMRHMRTMRRHRIFARIALQAFEAFNIIKGHPDAPRSDAMNDLLDDLFSSAAAADWRPTLSQSAALIGLVLSSWNKGPQRGVFDDNQTSPWRCAAHESTDKILKRLESYPMEFDNEDQTGLGSYEIVAGVSTTSPWVSGPMVGACGRRSQDCNGSIMAFEIPDAGLRLQVEPGVNPADAGRLSLYCLKVEI